MRGDGKITADTDVILAADIHSMFDVPDHVGRRRLSLHRQERHQVDTEHATLVGHALDVDIELAAWPIGNRSTGRMTDRHRFH